MAKWSCTVCTALNDGARTMCEICFTDRGSAPLIPDDTSGGGGGGNAPMDTREDGVWNCPQCTFENPPSAKACSICGAARPATSKPKAAKAKPKRVRATPKPRWKKDDPVPDKTPGGVKLNESDKKKVKRLREVGNCSNEHAISALMTTRGNLDQAVLWVMEHPEPGSGHELEPEPEPEPEPVHTPAPVKPKPKPAAVSRTAAASVPSKPKPTSALTEAKPAKSNGVTSVADRKRRLLEAAAKRKKEKAAEERKRAEVERQQKIMERQRKENIEKHQEHLKKVKEQRAREVAAAKQKEDKKANVAKLDFVKRQEIFAAKEKKIQDDFEKRRRRDEAELKTVADAVKALTIRYGEAMRNDTLQFISKLISKIVASPDERRFKSINAEATAFKEKVVVPLGGLVIMRLLGFKLSGEGTHWNLDRPDVPHMKKINEEITLVYMHKKTDIPKRLVELEKDIGPEMTYYAAEKLLEIFDNILSLKDRSIVGKIDIDDEAFKVLVGKHPKAVAIMKQYGFRLDKSPDKLEHRYLRLEDSPNLQAIRNAVGDLRGELKSRFSSIPIFKVLESLCNATSPPTVDFIVPRLTKCLQRILDEPLDLKIQSVRLDKFYKKSKVPKKEAHELFEILGFEVTPAADGSKRFDAKFSDKANIEVLRVQKGSLELAHKKVVGSSARRKLDAAKTPTGSGMSM